MNWKSFLLGAAAGFAAGIITKELLGPSGHTSPEKVLADVKEKLKKSGQIYGSWIVMKPETYVKNEVEYEVYNGGITRSIRLDCQEPTLAMLKRMVLRAGYAENMCKFAYFPSRIMGQNRKDVSTDSDVIEMIQCSQEIESLNLYVVREDDPYLDDVLIGDDVEEEPEDDAHIDFYQNDYVDSDDSDDDDEGSVIEFFVGQEFVSKEKCRGTIEKYAVREKVNIHFQKSEKKRVAAICAQECFKWRLFASINSQSDKMVVRSYKGEHNCYPIGVVDLYTAPKIAADFLNEFRHNPKLTADQIMQRLGIKGLRVTKTKCQSARQLKLFAAWLFLCCICLLVF